MRGQARENTDTQQWQPAGGIAHVDIMQPACPIITRTWIYPSCWLCKKDRMNCLLRSECCQIVPLAGCRFNVPMLILGGGGYTLRNVARCWCYETGRMMGIDLPDG